MSNDAKDFVASLLQRTPEKRPTAKQALQHSFIQKYFRLSCRMSQDSILLSKIHESIQRFIHGTDFRKIILQMIASRYLANEILDLTHIFTKYDTTGEGVLYFPDFKAIFSNYDHNDAELKDIFGSIVRILIIQGFFDVKSG
jgi:serine/threonine protein kinase